MASRGRRWKTLFFQATEVAARSVTSWSDDRGSKAAWLQAARAARRDVLAEHRCDEAKAGEHTCGRRRQAPRHAAFAVRAAMAVDWPADAEAIAAAAVFSTTCSGRVVVAAHNDADGLSAAAIALRALAVRGAAGEPLPTGPVASTFRRCFGRQLRAPHRVRERHHTKDASDSPSRCQRPPLRGYHPHRLIGLQPRIAVHLVRVNRGHRDCTEMSTIKCGTSAAKRGNDGN